MVSTNNRLKTINELLIELLIKNIKVKIHFQLSEIYFFHLEKLNKAITNYQKVIEISEDLVWAVKAYKKIGEVALPIKTMKRHENLQKLSKARD